MIRPLAAALLFVATAAYAEESVPEGYRRIEGIYSMGSKSIIDPTPEEKIDTVRFYLTGKTAADIWKTIPGKPKIDECSQLPEKTVGELVCLEDKPGQYRCNVGINLRSGKAVGASVC